MGMSIDFNNVRKQALFSYNRLVKTLNNKIEDSCDGKKVIVFVDDIEEDLNDLRQLIGAIACTFKKDDDDFQMVYTDDVSLVCFNEEEESPSMAKQSSAPENTSEAQFTAANTIK